MRLNTALSKARLRLRDGVVKTRSLVTAIEKQTTTDNVFHCCLHKTGSQWVKRILADPDVLRRTGLRLYEYQADMPGGHDPRPVNQRSFDIPFPLRTIVSPLYIDYENYRAISKPVSARAFFVTRDPRDLVVSWYFSQRYSHGLMGDTAKVRGTLGDLGEPDGLAYAIRYLDSFGVFDAQRSWLRSFEDPDALVVRFEDLIGPNGHGQFAEIFSHCRFEISDAILESTLSRYSFEKLSGRKQGSEDVYTHFRKGVAGDWQNHFDDEVSAVFSQVTGDLAQVLGY